MEYLLVGKIIDTFGLDGTLKIISSSNNQDVRYKKGSKLFLFDKEGKLNQEVKVKSYRCNGKFDFVCFEEISNINEAEQIQGFEIRAIKDRSDLDVGYYFYSDLVGCSIIDEQGNNLGVVTIVEEFPAQITLRVKRKNGKDFFVPFLQQFIKYVDVEKKIINIIFMEGML